MNIVNRDTPGLMKLGKRALDDPGRRNLTVGAARKDHYRTGQWFARYDFIMGRVVDDSVCNSG